MPVIRPILIFLLLPVFSFAQWTRTNGLPGGSVHGFLRYGDTVIANLSGLYFSADDGLSWSPVATPAGFLSSDLATDGHDLYVHGFSADSRIIARTSDFGQSWQSIPVADTMTFSDFFAAGPYVYGNDYHGIYRTADNGANWEYVTHTPVSHLRYDGQRMVGNRLNCLVQSLDLGFTWDTLLQFTGNVIDVLQHDNHLFVFMQKASDGCWASGDGGQNWQHFTGTAFDQLYTVFWHNGGLYGLKGTQLYRSDNLGQSWTVTSLSAYAGVPAYAGVSAGNAVLMGGVYSGVLRSTDGGASWAVANEALFANGSNRLRSIGTNLYAPANGGFFELDASGTDWIPWAINANAPGLNWYGYTDFTQAGDNLLFSDGKTPWVSLDGGQSWNESVAIFGFEDYYDQLKLIGNKVFASNAVPLLWNSLMVSEDMGATFQNLSTFNDQYNTVFGPVAFDNGRIFTLTIDLQLFVSNDAGETWTLLADNIPMDTIPPLQQWYPQSRDFWVVGNTVVIADYPDGPLISNDLGGTWHHYLKTGQNYVWGGPSTLSALVALGNWLIGGTTNRIVVSADGGANWTSWSDNLPGFWSASLEIHDGYLWAGLDGAGIWKRPLSDLGLQAATGLVFWDQNADGAKDFGEPGLPDVVVHSTTSNAYTTTHPDGTYLLLSGVSDENIQVEVPASYWSAAPAVQAISLPASNVNFALSFDSSARDLSVTLVNVSALQPGFESKYAITWRNEVPLPAGDAVVTMTYPATLLEFIEADPAPSMQTPGALSWSLGTLPGDANGTILVRVKVPPSVFLGTEICASAAIEPVMGDLWPNDNVKERCVQVVGSYDPNEKQSDPPSHLTPAQIDEGLPVVYTIRFQNLGDHNASFVHITDTIDAGFNAGTFQFLGASHPCSWTLLNEGVLEFYFNDIQLPPVLADEPGSHGFIQYSLRAKADLPLGTALRNTAHIVFDYNAPLTTNTTVLTVSLTSPAQEPPGVQKISLSPNPAHEFVRMETPQTGLLTVFDAGGKLVEQHRVGAGTTVLDLHGWASGAYLFRFENERMRGEARLLIQ